MFNRFIDWLNEPTKNSIAQFWGNIFALIGLVLLSANVFWLFPVLGITTIICLVGAGLHLMAENYLGFFLGLFMVAISIFIYFQ